MVIQKPFAKQIYWDFGREKDTSFEAYGESLGESYRDH